jgi:UDP-glucose 4-epimerase
MKVLVTGATGFIGKNLTQRLLREGFTVYALVRRTSNTALLSSQGVNLLYGDVGDCASLEVLRPHSFDMMFHCAGSVQNKDRKELRRVNVAGTENICRCALRDGVKKVVYISSVAVVSGNEDVPLTEELPYKASNPYGRSKIEAEKKALAARKEGLPMVIVRPPMVYGEGEPHLLGLMLSLLYRRLLPIPARGDYKLHLVYVHNVVDAIMTMIKDDAFLEGTFFVADKEVLTVREILTALSQGLGIRPPVSVPEPIVRFLTRVPFLGKRIRFFLKDRVYSIEKIASFGFTPAYEARRALAQSARHWRTQRDRR